MVQIETIEIRAVLFGAIALWVGYVAMSVAASALVAIAGLPLPVGASFFLWLLGAVAPAVAGYIGARFAHTRRILHGVIAAVVGGVVMMAIPVFFSGLPNFYSLVGSLVLFAVLSLPGSVFAVYKRAKAGP